MTYVIEELCIKNELTGDVCTMSEVLGEYRNDLERFGACWDKYIPKLTKDSRIVAWLTHCNHWVLLTLILMHGMSHCGTSIVLIIHRNSKIYWIKW